MGPLLAPIAWWIWLALALSLALLELFGPGTVFLGFAIGAAAMAIVAALAPTFSGAAVLALFALLSLAAWYLLRRIFKRQSSGPRIITRDINDD